MFPSNVLNGAQQPLLRVSTEGLQTARVLVTRHSSFGGDDGYATGHISEEEHHDGGELADSRLEANWDGNHPFKDGNPWGADEGGARCDSGMCGGLNQQPRPINRGDPMNGENATHQNMEPVEQHTKSKNTNAKCDTTEQVAKPTAVTTAAATTVGLPHALCTPQRIRQTRHNASTLHTPHMSNKHTPGCLDSDSITPSVVPGFTTGTWELPWP
ncbi:hypothetical protein C8J57DRAFT_1234314 [Mycena rebaudengoi]|nr:hypothetical protein C8J57DRAFT_1234314 [Mycena rebaudengoi]